MITFLTFFILSILTVPSLQGPTADAFDPDRAVLAHYIFGVTYSHTAEDFQNDFQLASDTGIDALVFNIAQDDWTQSRLDTAFTVAPNYFTKICFSFDFAVAPWTTQSVIATLQRYANQAGYFRYSGKGGGKSLVSTFDGPANNNVDWVAVKAAVPNIFVVPHLSPDEVKAHPAGIDGALNWNTWATQNNQPIDGDSSTVDDHIMQDALTSSQAYASLTSAWSYTFYQAYGVNKEWIFKSDELLVKRWNQMLTFAESEPGAHIDLIELYSWNDYGESNYINDISKAHDDEFSGRDDLWCKGFKHDGWRKLNVPFIKTFKQHLDSVPTSNIETELVVLQHRPYPAKTLCSGQTDPVPGAQFVPDQVTIFSALTSPAQLVIESGGQTTDATVEAGIQTTTVPMQLGSQSVTVYRNGNACGQVTSAVQVTNTCSFPNYNANVEYIIVKCC